MTPADRMTRLAIALAVVAALASGCVTRVIVEPCQPKAPQIGMDIPLPGTTMLTSLDGVYYDGCNTHTCKDGICLSTLVWCGGKSGLWVKQETKP